MTTAEMLSRISSEELAEQMAYDMVTAEDEQARREGRPLPDAPRPDARDQARRLHAWLGRNAKRKD